MPDNLSFQEAIILVVITAVATHWLPGLISAANNWYMRSIRRIEVVAEANADNAQASKTTAERESIWQKNYENVVQALFERDREIAELNKRVAALEIIQAEYEREKQARITAEANVEAERELRIEIEEEFAVAKDKWRLEKKSLEEQICELRDQVVALEEKFARLENLQKSTIQQVKDEVNEQPSGVKTPSGTTVQP